MYTLGISAFYHDSAAVLLKDSRLLFAAEEERFTRIKHDNSFPRLAIRHCLESAGISANDIDDIAYYEKPLLKFERVLGNFVDTYPRSMRPFVKGVPEWLADKLNVEHTIRKELGFTKELFFIPHHYSHAGAAFFPSPYEKAAILTTDGIGEYQTAGLWTGNGTMITPLRSQNFPHSLGLLYATFTAFLGFRVNEDEYKVMGLAALGRPRFTDAIRTMVRIRDDGSFRLDLRFFRFRESFTMWSKEFEKRTGKPRLPSEPVIEFHADIAASIQEVTEDIYFKTLRYLHRIANSENLCISGGVALNALANGKIPAQTPFKNVYIFGASGDSGAAVGAALYAAHSLHGITARQPVTHLRYGTSYTNEDIERALREAGVTYERFQQEEELCDRVAALLAENNDIGWFQGKMEFGPRALGSRSILANPRLAGTKDDVNKIKGREEFRPFGGSVLADRLDEFVDTHGAATDFPFMNFCFRVKNEKRSEIPAIVHRDGSCRVQTVDSGYGQYYALLKSFAALTGTPFLLNTSFNIAGEPIVEAPAQAVSDFLSTPLDYLAIGDFLAVKEPRPE